MRTGITAIRRNEKGILLLEIVIALAVLGIVAVALLTSLATGAMATSIAKERAIAENLARSQIEYIKNTLPYVEYSEEPPLTTYTIKASIVPTSTGWAVPDAVVEPVASRGAGIQKITVTVLHNGKQILTLTDYKMSR